MDFKNCNRCKRNLPIEEFERYYGARGETNLKSSRTSYCKKCRSELRLINLLKKKYYIIKTIFNGKCCECDTGLEYLPCFEFHHLNPKLKSGKTISLSRNWEETKKQVEREKAILVISNTTGLVSWIPRKAIKHIDSNSITLQDWFKDKVQWQEDKVF